MNNLPSGTKRTLGFIIMLLPAIAPMFGFEVSEAFPIESARFADQVVEFVGAAVMIYGVWVAKSPMWITKKK